MNTDYNQYSMTMDVHHHRNVTTGASRSPPSPYSAADVMQTVTSLPAAAQRPQKRSFDVAFLMAPDDLSKRRPRPAPNASPAAVRSAFTKVSSPDAVTAASPQSSSPATPPPEFGYNHDGSLSPPPLTQSQLSQLSQSQLSQLSPSQLSQLSQTQLSQLSQAQLTQLSQAHLSQMSQAQLSQMSQTQLSQMSQAQPPPHTPTIAPHFMSPFPMGFRTPAAFMMMPPRPQPAVACKDVVAQQYSAATVVPPPQPLQFGPGAAAALPAMLLPASIAAAALTLPSQNVCAKCNVSFRMTSDLVYHMRSHHKGDGGGGVGGMAGAMGGLSGVGIASGSASDAKKRRDMDKLRCPVCDESFRERHHLTRHMTAHQDKEGDRLDDEDEPQQGAK